MGCRSVPRAERRTVSQSMVPAFRGEVGSGRPRGRRALEHADGLALGATVLDAALHVGLGPRVRGQSRDHDVPEGPGGLAVPTAVQPVAGHLPRRPRAERNRTDGPRRLLSAGALGCRRRRPTVRPRCRCRLHRRRAAREHDLEERDDHGVELADLGFEVGDAVGQLGQRRLGCHGDRIRPARRAQPCAAATRRRWGDPERGLQLVRGAEGELAHLAERLDPAPWAERLATTRTRMASTEPSLDLALPWAPPTCPLGGLDGVEGIGLAALSPGLAVLAVHLNDVDPCSGEVTSGAGPIVPVPSTPILLISPKAWSQPRDPDSRRGRPETIACRAGHRPGRRRRPRRPPHGCRCHR